MSLVIAQQLSGLYREIVNGESFSRTTNTDISDVDRNLCEFLAIVELEENHGSVVRSWSVVDSSGLHYGVDCPWGNEVRIFMPPETDSHFRVRYSVHNNRIRFTLMLGRAKWRLLCAPLLPDGSFDASRVGPFLQRTVTT
jgi:hypothetical protein